MNTLHTMAADDAVAATHDLTYQIANSLIWSTAKLAITESLCVCECVTNDGVYICVICVCPVQLEASTFLTWKIMFSSGSLMSRSCVAMRFSGVDAWQHCGRNFRGYLWSENGVRSDYLKFLPHNTRVFRVSCRSTLCHTRSHFK